MPRFTHKDFPALRAYAENMVHTFNDAERKSNPEIERDEGQQIEELNSMLGTYVDKLLSGLEILVNKTAQQEE